MSGLTPSQTVGPYLSLGLPWETGAVADPDGLTIRGRVLDGDGAPVPDALIETWQTDPRAFTRCATDDDGAWSVTVPQPAGGPGRHVAVNVFGRGMLHRVVTRIYLDADADDPVLATIPADRRGTLIAVADGERAYRFDVRLQGDDETVFFDV